MARQSSTAAGTKNALSPTVPIVELREYTLHPGRAVDFRQKTLQTADLRQSLSPLRLFSTCETGDLLHKVTHAYFYPQGHTERDSKRLIAAEHPDWKAYVGSVLSCLASQMSTIWVEAPLVRKHSDIHGLATVPINLLGDTPIFEFRRYKLKLGYDTVPNFLSLYDSGLSSKLKATGTDPTTTLVTVMYTEVGRLNEVMEIWRHGNGSSAMETSRQAARQAVEWRTAIGSIADLAVEFSTSIHKPLEFSPLR